MTSSQKTVIITDVGSVDIDDIFALLCAFDSPDLLGIIATHHYEYS